MIELIALAKAAQAKREARESRDFYEDLMGDLNDNLEEVASYLFPGQETESWVVIPIDLNKRVGQESKKPVRSASRRGGIAMTYEEWLDNYSPIINDISHPFSRAETMFETYGADWEKVKSTDLRHVWTWIEDDNGDDVLVAGRAFVNRLGYYITEKPWDSPMLYVDLTEPEA